MNDLQWISFLSVGLFGAALLWTAASDLLTLRIPNRAVLVILGLYPVYVLTAGQAVPWPAASLIAAVSFAIGFALFATNLFGGGDVKLFAATALWAGPAHIVPLLFATAGSVVAPSASRQRSFVCHGC